MSTDSWLTTEQVAKLANRSPYTIRRHVRDGHLDARRDPITGRIYVLEAVARQLYHGVQPQGPSAIDAPNNARRRRRGVLLD